jgi:hypothetical protein
MTKKLNFDAIHGHVEHEPAQTHSRIAAELLATEKPDAEASPTIKPLDFSAIHGWEANRTCSRYGRGNCE